VVVLLALVAGCGLVAGLGADYELGDAATADAHLDAPTRDATAEANEASPPDAPDAPSISLDATAAETNEASPPVDAVALDGPSATDSAAADALDGQSPITLYTGGAGSSPYFIGAGAGQVYWTDKGATTAGVRYVDVDTLPAPPGPAHTVADAGAPAVVIVAAGTAYWTEQNLETVTSYSPDAGTTTLPAAPAGIPFGVAAIPGVALFCTTSSGTVDALFPVTKALTNVAYPSLGYLVTDSTNLYWVDSSGGVVQEVSSQGGAALTLASGQSQPTGIACGEGYVFWTNKGDGTIRHVFPGDAGGAAVIATDPPGVANIVFSFPYLYWTNAAAGTISRCSAPDCMGGSTVIAANQVQPFGIAVDGSYVYWTNEGNGTTGGAVMALHK
jgi:hypothetical protein